MTPLSETLAYMREHGSSVVLTWGEDNDLWECSWITSGRRYSAFSRDPEAAARQVLREAPSGSASDAPAQRGHDSRRGH